MKNLIDINVIKTVIFLTIVFAGTISSGAQELYPLKISDSLWHGEQRELRYRPDGSDFVITNGNRLFTRALYGTNTSFRVETGDRPEFALYMPGMGGNIKFGIAVAGKKSKWLSQAQTVTARYRPGSMLYAIQDPLIGNGTILLEVLALADADGVIIKARMQNVQIPVTLYWVFGGASGKNFSRNGDMGPDPESNFYLKPENCRDNIFDVTKGSFTLKYGTGLKVFNGRYSINDSIEQSKALKEKHLAGTFPQNAVFKISDSANDSPNEFFDSSGGNTPALAVKLNAVANTDYYFTIHNPASKPVFSNNDAAKLFADAEQARKSIADRVTINTPDPYINTIGGAIAIASDAIWEAPSYLHGSIGWRMRLNGWRGAYTADVLGWHDRAKMHLQSYAKSQVTLPPNGIVVADTVHHLARSLEKLGVGMFTSGYISRNPNGEKMIAHHYDMNLVYIDILLRHYAWTGDRMFLKETWPVLKLHLEWEKRNFDSNSDGLYDAYAAIWASDALQYSGGGVTHTSAYNYFANAKAAQIAILLGEDPAPYHNEADKIITAMNSNLWMTKKGIYAEFKDALGNRLLHTAPALWSVYHSMDSETMNAFQAYQSLRYIDNEIPHIPIKANGLKDEGYYTLSTTKWMPYEWSLNNVALAESMHTALANWQGGRTDEAFKLFKSEILASMYLGGSPGNMVQISHYDAVRREAYRDFGDPVGMTSRALVEGLFGIVPDALNNTLLLRPGLPSGWDFASFSTPDISFDFKRAGRTDMYTIISKLPQKPDLKLRIIAQGQVQNITVNGNPATWKNIDSAVGMPLIEINVPASEKYVITTLWEGLKPVLPAVEKTYTDGSILTQQFTGAKILAVHDPQNVLSGIKINASGLSATVNTFPGHHTAFLQLQQGKLSWWMPLCFITDKPVTLLTGVSPEVESQNFRLQNNTAVTLNTELFVNGFKAKVKLLAGAKSDVITIPEKNLITGTNTVTIKLPDGKTVSEQLFVWHATTAGTIEHIDMGSYFNDKVNQIFKNKYLSPRPKTTTLQLPWQGIGDWPHSQKKFDTDDSGLRKLAGKNNVISLQQGISFSTPSAKEAPNILYTSQWDNYPAEKSVTLKGKASHAWFLMAGSTNPMQSQFDNGSIVVEYTDGTKDTLVLRNPETWWPIDQDYYTDGFAFKLQRPRPIRIHLKTGAVVYGTESKERYNGKEIEGGAATVLDMPLKPSKELKQLTLKTLANDVVIGLMAVTLLR